MASESPLRPKHPVSASLVGPYGHPFPPSPARPARPGARSRSEFLASLVILDPLAAVLVGLVRREGIWLASAVMVLDVSANWYGNRHWLSDDPAQLLSLLPNTVFCVFVVVCAVPLHRAVAWAMSGSPVAVPSA